MTTETLNTQVVTVDDTHINILTIGTQGPAGSGGGGSIDHGTLTGLSDDDHTQYLNNARGDARYAALSHTHTASQIVDFDEAVEDKIGTKLVAGSNITVTYNDTTGETTVTASASSYTDEQSQDAVGAILTDTTTIDLTYDDATPAISAQLPLHVMNMLSLTSIFYISGSYYDAGGADASAYGIIAQAVNRMELHPIVFNEDFETDQIAINVSTAVASSLSKVIVYDANTSGQPNNLIKESGDLDCSTIGSKTEAWSYTFNKGQLYWIGVRSSSTQTLRGLPLSSVKSLGRGLSTSASKFTCIRQTLAYATAAPSTWTWSATDLTSGVITAAAMFRRI